MTSEMEQATRTDAPAESAPKESGWEAYKTDFKWATPLLFVLVLAIPGFLWASWERPTAGTEDMTSLTTLIFSQQGLVAPFEILSVLLLAALIAGIVIAIRDPDTGWNQ